MSFCYPEDIQRRPKTMHVTIFSQPGCHLCHVALRIARHVQVDVPFILHSVDITHDSELLILYGHRIPVVLIDQRERFAGKMTERDLRAALKKARWSKSISRILSRLGLHPNR
jgi:glutaredoxin